MPDKAKLKRFYYLLNRLVGHIDRVELILTFAFMLIIVTMGAMEIFTRYILNKSLFFVHEITILLANWMYFLGFCLVFNRNRDIDIEFFVRKLTQTNRKVLSLITNTAVLYFLMILSYFAFKLLLLQSRHTTEGLGIPNHYFSMPIFISTLSIIIINIKNILAIYLDMEET
jgi:TRAP-type C4-dicarboxylate transport system permease small subunit